jgi:hypothetical protein
MRLFDRINIISIFIKHKNTFYDYGILTWNGKFKVPFADKFIFIIFPFLISALLVIFQMRITDEFLNILITSLSIFVGLLFSLLTLVFEIAQKEKERNKNQEVSQKQIVKFKLEKELFVNIAFAIALSILSIVTALLTRFQPKLILTFLKSIAVYNRIKEYYLITTNFIAIFLVVLFLLTLLMILKRFFLIFNFEFED